MKKPSKAKIRDAHPPTAAGRKEARSISKQATSEEEALKREDLDLAPNRDSTFHQQRREKTVERTNIPRPKTKKPKSKKPILEDTKPEMWMSTQEKVVLTEEVPLDMIDNMLAWLETHERLSTILREGSSTGRLWLYDIELGMEGDCWVIDLREKELRLYAADLELHAVSLSVIHDKRRLFILRGILNTGECFRLEVFRVGEVGLLASLYRAKPFHSYREPEDYYVCLLCE